MFQIPVTFFISGYLRGAIKICHEPGGLPTDMSFISLQFLVFFMVVTLSYYQLQNQRMRIALLLAASCYFYMTFVPKYILILGGTIVIDYLAGLQIARSTGRSRKTWLIVSIIANVGVLAFFKYFNFLLGSFEPLIHWASSTTDIPVLNILLPIGLSFHTFQAMSYTIEVYRGKQPAEKDFLTYALYVMFYPQLVAGPIERPRMFFPSYTGFRNTTGIMCAKDLHACFGAYLRKLLLRTG